MMELANSNGNLYQKDSSSRSSSDKVYQIICVVAFVFALAAFIIALVSLSRQTGGGPMQVNVSSGPAAQSVADDDKVWLLHIGHTGSNLEYIDEESGQVKGFNPDIANAVCRIANKNCKLVFDVYKNCWENVAGETARGGFGLMAGWYDACAAWRVTDERKRTFAFSDIFSRPPFHAFVTLSGNADGFNWRDLTGKKIGFYDGFSSNEHCIAKGEGIVGKDLAANQIFHYHNLDAMIEAMKAKEIDAIFTGITLITDTPEVENVSGNLNLCNRRGFGMMTRFDSKLIEWWNPAQEKLLASKEYNQICQDVLEAHGDVPGEDPEEFCL